jgi:hypothetical protein
VLSLSTNGIDLREKPAEYLQLPSLLAYLVFSQDEPEAWVWMRAEGKFSPKPSPVKGHDETINVSALKITLPLKSVYARLGPR